MNIPPSPGCETRKDSNNSTRLQHLARIGNPNASPGCIVSPRTDQSECFPDIQMFSPNSFDDAELQIKGRYRVGGILREEEIATDLYTHDLC